MRVVALIPAAGVGKRMGTSISKPFLRIGDKPILAQTLLRFEDSKEISEVYVITSKREEKRCREDIVNRYNLKKVTKIVIGGVKRQDSVKNGLEAIDPTCDIVMVHDGLRPFITPQLIDESISKTQKYDATVVAVPVKETVKRVSPGGEIIETLDRKRLYLAQTPQTFKYDIIKRAYENAFENNIVSTDDSSLVELLGIRVRVILGSYGNIKITTPEDLIIAGAFLDDGDNAAGAGIR
ncbi:MAG: 2-C-methyl-D-erythritol 4-phosphate cytidylyltransferase [Pseudomonadota bacterium]